MDTRVKKESQEGVQVMATRELPVHQGRQDHPDRPDQPFL